MYLFKPNRLHSTLTPIFLSLSAPRARALYQYNLCERGFGVQGPSILCNQLRFLPFLPSSLLPPGGI